MRCPLFRVKRLFVQLCCRIVVPNRSLKDKQTAVVYAFLIFLIIFYLQKPDLLDDYFDKYRLFSIFTAS